MPFLQIYIFEIKFKIFGYKKMCFPLKCVIILQIFTNRLKKITSKVKICQILSENDYKKIKNTLINNQRIHPKGI